jgi:hypothetical protein
MFRFVEPHAQVDLAAAGPAVAVLGQTLYELRQVEPEVHALGSQRLLRPTRRVEQRRPCPQIVVGPGCSAAQHGQRHDGESGNRAHHDLLRQGPGRMLHRNDRRP